MFVNYLKSGAVRRLHSLLDDPLSFDALEFVSENSLQLAHGASSVNDLYIFADVYENIKRELYSIIPLLIHELRTEVGLLELPRREYDKYPLPVFVTFEEEVEYTNGASQVFEIDIINQQIERMFEHFEVSSNKLTSEYVPDVTRKAVAFYMLSDLLYLTFYGFSKLSFKPNNVVSFSVNNSHNDGYFKRKWFANFWEQSSSIASIANLNYVDDNIPVKSAQGFIKLISDDLLDKTFSLNWKHLSRKVTRTEGFRMMQLLTDAVALLLYCKLKLSRNFADSEDFTAIGITQEELNQLKRVNRELIKSDRLLEFNSGKIFLINPCVSIHSRRVIEVFTRISGDKELDNVVGKFFEQKYIAAYIQETINKESSRYRVYEGIEAHHVFKQNRDGDVDLIVEDTLREKFIFMQVKYIRNAGRPFLRGDVEYLTNSKVLKGIKQLKAMSAFHKEELLENALVQRGVSNCTFENTIYMFVSNITNFDFQKDERNNIVFYEWNTLRNLLLDGRCIYGYSNDMLAQQEWRHHSPLPLEQPSEVIDILLENSPALKLVKASDIFNSRYLKTSFSLNNYSFESIGLGM